MNSMNEVVITSREEMDECPFYRDVEINLFLIAKMVAAEGIEGK